MIVFEGHLSALESGVRDSDLHFIDTGLRSFLQQDWADVVYQAMKPDAKVLYHDRKSYTLMPIFKTEKIPGWQLCSEPDGEESYVRCLLTTLAKEGSGRVVRIIDDPDLPLPDLATLTKIPKELDWISRLPFNYHQLNVGEVLEILASTISGFLSIFKKSWTFHCKLVLSKNKHWDRFLVQVRGVGEK